MLKHLNCKIDFLRNIVEHFGINALLQVATSFHGNEDTYLNVDEGN